MLRRSVIVASLAILSVSLNAQAPAGWSVRIDRSQSASDPDGSPDLKFATMGKGFHVTGGPAGTFWNPANTGTGNYTAKATFTLAKPSGHTNYYGLVVGGEDLGGPKQNYIYFLVAQNGTYIVKHRAGDAVHDVQASTPHESIKKPDAKGSSTNALEVRVGRQHRLLRGERHGGPHHAQNRHDREDRWPGRHPGQSPAGCPRRRIRGPEGLNQRSVRRPASAPRRAGSRSPPVSEPEPRADLELPRESAAGQRGRHQERCRAACRRSDWRSSARW